MLWTTIKRISKAGFISFWRNGFVTLSTVSVMVVTLFVIGLLFFSSAILDQAMMTLRDKVDLRVYLRPEAAEADIQSLQKSLQALPEVSKVDYVSREKVLADFKDANQNDQVMLESLDLLGDNPLGAELNIKAKDTSQYEGITRFLEQGDTSRDGGSIIGKINFYQNKTAIDTLSRLIDSGTQLGFFLALVFVFISFMITFNTVRLAIFIAKDEIAVMKLVGASNMYVRGPFIITGFMYGITAGIITTALFYPITYWLGPKTDSFFTGMNVFSYYIAHCGPLSLLLIGSGIFIGAFSSYVAVRKYLSV